MTIEVDRYINQVALPMKAVFRDMLKYAPSKVFGLLGNAAIVPIYTNLLSPSQYGVYAISLAVLSFLCIIFSDWIGLSGLRFFRQNQLCDKIPKYISTLVLVLISNLIFMFILAFCCKHICYSYFNIQPKIFLFILLLVIPVSVRALLFQVLRAQIKPGAFTISTIANQILTIIFSVLLLKYTSLGAMSILVGMAVSISIIDVILVFQSDLLKYFRFEKLQSDMIKSIFVYGIPIAVASISLWTITQSNKFILKRFHGFDEVGLVGVAYNMTFPILLTLFAIITIAAFPRIINLYEDKTDVRPIISKLTGYFLVIALPLVSIMALYSESLMKIFAHQDYANAYILLPYLAFSAFFLSLTEYTTMQYHLANKTYILTNIKVASGILGLILNIVLIKAMGLLGVGIATLVSNILYFLLSVIVVIPGLEWRLPFKKLIHILFCFIPSGLLYYFLYHSAVGAIYQMLALLIVFYCSYYFSRKLFKDSMI